MTRVVIASDETASEHGLEIIRLAKASGAKVALVPPLLNVMGSSVQYDDLGGQALLSMRPFGLSRGSRALKRTFDVALAGLALVVLFATAVGHRNRGSPELPRSDHLPPDPDRA